MSDKGLFVSILKRSWKLLWDKPSLWVYGFFATAVSGLGVYEIVLSSWNTVKETTGPVLDLSTAPSATLTWLTPPYNNLFLPFAGILSIAITIFLFFVSVISLGALIRGVVDKKKHTLSSLWSHGVSHVWPMAVLVVGRRIAVGLLLLLMVLVASFVFGVGGLLGGVLSILSGVLFTILIVVISFLAIYAATAIVVDQLTFKEALYKSWEVFQKHVLVSLEMALVLILVEIGFTVLAVASFILVALPIFMLWLLSGLTGVSVFFTFGILLAIVLLSILIFLFAAWVTMFDISVWSYLYVKVRKGVVKSRVLHFFGH